MKYPVLIGSALAGAIGIASADNPCARSAGRDSRQRDAIQIDRIIALHLVNDLADHLRPIVAGPIAGRLRKYRDVRK